ncbi:uncharacterized protein B0H18DRAFT_1120741 [Fomitopsis serialis]|uniref:uncharacterized protein n=1 Tax=Fomitopsis serialis TaxID=139415 RepID=UPI0020072BF1|nr:uncharacterized protein B0H18DRAFT_1120741 [Neoantrodia serialis]KAH9922739.1 hypothetical protein B0H18DRAFT_1120741 [Neoantrodia serialis]
MDPTQFHNANSGDHMPEVSLGTSPAAVYANATIHNNLVAHREHSHELQLPPDAQEEERCRHVSVGHFDPTGVDELKRTMSRLMPAYASHHSSDRSSDHTLAPGDGPFDFEKSLQHLVRRTRRRAVQHVDRERAGLMPRVKTQPTDGPRAQARGSVGARGRIDGQADGCEGGLAGRKTGRKTGEKTGEKEDGREGRRTDKRTGRRTSRRASGQATAHAHCECAGRMPGTLTQPTDTHAGPQMGA